MQNTPPVTKKLNQSLFFNKAKSFPKLPKSPTEPTLINSQLVKFSASQSSNTSLVLDLANESTDLANVESKIKRA